MPKGTSGDRGVTIWYLGYLNGTPPINQLGLTLSIPIFHCNKWLQGRPKPWKVIQVIRRRAKVEDIMDEVNTFVRIDAQHRDFWQVLTWAMVDMNDGWICWEL